LDDRARQFRCFVVMLVTVLASFASHVATSTADDAACGDADTSGDVTVSDGVNVLRAAADLSAVCPVTACDVDGNGVISVSDGVNVLRAAAGLAATLNCVADPFISAVKGEDGKFGPLVKTAGGLSAPSGAPQTVTNVAIGDGFVEGRSNTVSIDYDTGDVQAQAASDDTTLLIGSARGSEDSDGVFNLPLTNRRGTVTVTLDLKPDVAVQRFTLKITTGANGNVVGQVFSVDIFVVVREPHPECGNRVLDVGETCDPPETGCPAPGGGFCNDSCVCKSVIRFVDNGDGTVTDKQNALQWEKKTGVVGTLRDCTLATCTDPHDVNNTYQWCADVDHVNLCDTAGNPPDGVLFTLFLATLNSPPCFAGHCDWRLPTINRYGQPAELETLVNLGVSGCGNTTTPCIDPTFGPTNPGNYWSATARSADAGDALGISFFDGGLIDQFKADDFYARAVRDSTP
jgi:hypothetical protein